MATKKETASKAKTAKAAATAKPQAKPAPEIKVSKAPAVEVVEALGLYGIKSAVGGLNIKAIPLPGKRVLLVLPGGLQLIDDLSIVKEGNSYALK